MRNSHDVHDVLVIGAGPSGVAAALSLRDRGLHPLLIDRAPDVGASWRSRDDRLRLNTGRRTSHLPIPSDYLASPMFDAPSRLVDPLARLGGRITVGDLSAYGLPTPTEGVFARGKRQGRAPVIVDREIIDAIRDGAFEVVPTIAHFDNDGVTLIDGRRLDPDVVICATGYHRGLEPILGHLGVLDADGNPRAQGRRAAAPGLRFLGFQSRPGLIGRVARESWGVERCIADELAARQDERGLAPCVESC